VDGAWLVLPMRASEYFHHQLRFTPHPTEPGGWMIEQAGEDFFIFSSEHPHIEGGRHPLKHFELSTPNISDTAKEHFYAQNFVDLVGQ